MYKSIYQKGNESQKHYILKQISKYVAFERSCKVGAEEVYLLSKNELGRKLYADYVAIKLTGGAP